MDNPCLTCGACCAYYRVSFYWSEADPFLGGQVPAEMTEPVNRFYIAMKGSNQMPPRCCALAGQIGEGVHCAIYEQRPQVCRDIMYTGFDGQREEKCDKARRAHGMPPLTPDHNPDEPVWPRSA